MSNVKRILKGYIMSNLYNALTTADSYTENGALTNSTSGSGAVDYFFGAGASRQKPPQMIIDQFENAFAQNPDHAIRILLWARDVREGAGERRHFRIVLSHLIQTRPALAQRVIMKISELGRWDDVLVAMDTPLEDFAIAIVAVGLVNNDRLCAKWMPRQGRIADKFIKAVGLTRRQWRQGLVRLSDTVEQKMCANLWDEIEYSKVPSVAHSRYRRAFGRHSPTQYVEYLNRVHAGSEKINASAIFPYDIVRGVASKLRHNALPQSERDAIVAQWNALPEYVNTDESIIPVIDVSGSMMTPVSGQVTAYEIAVSLGVYVSERAKGLFKDQFITFTANPRMFNLSGDVVRRIAQVYGSEVGYNTDLIKVFRTILDKAVSANLSQSDLPSKVLILSDMEFDGGQVVGNTNHDEIIEMYEEKGFTPPQLVYWNLVGRSNTNVPVKITDSGTALVSGFSPAIMKSLLGSNLTPESVMLDTIMKDRYAH